MSLNVSNQTAYTQDIMVLPPNSFLGGEDKIIGDIHGNLSCLRSVLASIGEHDRLFMVGDLIDRGEQSGAIIPAISLFQQHHPSQIYTVKGNHELMCMRAINELEAMVSYFTEETDWDVNTEFDQSFIDTWIYDFMNRDMQTLESLYPDTDVYDLRLYITNGGAWLIYLFRHEVEQELIAIDENGKVIYREESSLLQIKKFIESLPYIIHIPGPSGFNIVHADMPLSDQELNTKISLNDFTLTSEQREYAVWAREDDSILFRDNGRDKHSTRTFVGHSIVAFGHSSVIRKTNTINLDIATFRSDMCLIVNQRAGTCELQGPGMERIYKYPALQSAFEELSLYLQKH